MADIQAGPDFAASTTIKPLFFLLVILAGQVLCPILLATFAFAKSVKRPTSLMTLLAATVIYSLGVCTLLYTGHDTGPQPSHGLCLAQLSLIYGALTMAAVAAASLVLGLLLTIPNSECEQPLLSVPTRVLLSGTPLIAFVLFILALVMADVAAPGSLVFSRGRLVHLCTFAGSTPVAYRKMGLFAAGAGLVVAATVMVVIIFRVVWAGRAAFGAWCGGSWLRFLRRFALLLLYMIIAGITAAAELATRDGSAVHDAGDLIAGTLPLVVFLLFGTMPDVLGVWAFWRRGSGEGDTEPEKCAV